uniref:Secreted protein n=1 Tax=Ixodes scapularis TaxID=6945 RepID=A0A4D5RYV6_IXOSC
MRRYCRQPPRALFLTPLFLRRLLYCSASARIRGNPRGDPPSRCRGGGCRGGSRFGHGIPCKCTIGSFFVFLFQDARLEANLCRDTLVCRDV